jgi:hypothetical protein
MDPAPVHVQGSVVYCACPPGYLGGRYGYIIVLVVTHLLLTLSARGGGQSGVEIERILLYYSLLAMFPIATNPAARMPHFGESLGSARVMIGITSECDTDEASPDSAGISRTGRSDGFSKVR